MFDFRTFLKINILGIISFFYFSCSDLLISDFEVKNFSYDKEKVQIEFSSDIDSNSVKKAFSLSENNKKTDGIIKCKGSVFQYFPLNGIQENNDYEISINTQAEDCDGKSLKEKFNKKFSTKPEATEPEINSVYPENNSIIDTKINFIEINFTKPIKTESFINAFSIEPSFDYFIEFLEDDKKIHIIPEKKLSESISYNLTVSTELQDIYNNYLKEDFITRWSTGKDEKPPEYKITYFDYDKNCVQIDEKKDNHNIPLPVELEINFNEEIKIDYAAAKISISPSSINYSIKSDKEKKNRIILTVEGNYNENCSLLIKKGIEDNAGNSIEEEKKYILIFDNEYYRPVTFVKAYLQQDENRNFKELNNDTQFTEINFDPLYFSPDRSTKEAELYLIFNVSKNSSGIDYFSAVDALSFKTTNSCCSIVIKKAEIISEEKLNTNPLNLLTKNGDEKLSVIKFTLDISNTNKNGLFEMIISDDIKDSLGNKINSSSCLIFNK